MCKRNIFVSVILTNLCETFLENNVTTIIYMTNRWGWHITFSKFQWYGLRCGYNLANISWKREEDRAICVSLSLAEKETVIMILLRKWQFLLRSWQTNLFWKETFCQPQKYIQNSRQMDFASIFIVGDLMMW